MATEVKLPRLGQGMESGTIVRWLKTEGDAVTKGEPLYELDTDKVTQEVEAESDGVLLKIVIADGEVDVGTTVAIIGAQDEDVSTLLAGAQGGNGGGPAVQAPPEDAAPTEAAPKEAVPKEAAPTEAAPEAEPDPAQAPSDTVSQAAEAPAAEEATAAPPGRGVGEPVKASPLARRIARERGVDLAQIAGTGPEGRVIAEDVEKAAVRPAAPAPAAAEPAEAEVVELTSTRRTIARRLTEAWQAPVFQLTVTADATELVDTRERMVELLREGETKPTVSDVLTRIVASALVRHAPVNAHFVDGRIHRFAAANVGIAVAAPSGLVVPVIRDADRKSVQQIAADRADVVARARREAAARRPRGRDFHHLEPGHVRHRAVRRRPQPAAGRDLGGWLDRRPSGGDRRRFRDRPDDDDDADVRPPRDRRIRGCRVPARREVLRGVAGTRALRRARSRPPSPAGAYSPGTDLSVLQGGSLTESWGITVRYASGESEHRYGPTLPKVGDRLGRGEEKGFVTRLQVDGPDRATVFVGTPAPADVTWKDVVGAGPVATESARERILAAAYELFSEKGIRAVGTEEILRRADVSRSTLYRHFRTKEVLVLAFLQRREQRWTRDFVEAEARRRASTPREQLLAIFDVFDEWFHRDDFDGCSFINTLLEVGDLDDPVGKASAAHLEYIRSVVRVLAEEAGIEDPEAFAKSWHVLMKGSIVQAEEGDTLAAKRAQGMAAALLDSQLPPIDSAAASSTP